MNELFIGVVDFESDGLDEPFDNRFYVLAADDGLAQHTITGNNSIVASSPRRAAGTVLDVLEADEEDGAEQLYEDVSELDGDEPWTEVVEDVLDEYDVTFDREEAEESGLIDYDLLRKELHNYLVRQRRAYRSYGLQEEAYRAGKMPDWKEPAEDVGLLDLYVDHEFRGMAGPRKLPERMPFLKEVYRQVEAGEI